MPHLTKHTSNNNPFSLSSRVIQSSEKYWQRYANQKGVDWTGYLEVLGFGYIDLNEFYVYELIDEDFYLHASYCGDLEVEIELEESHTLSRRIEANIMVVEVFLEMECKVHNQKIEDLKLESWDFE